MRTTTTLLGGVAGIHVRAFVERCRLGPATRACRGVSPGFTSRPSLSVHDDDSGLRVPQVSPGFTSGPSLSGLAAVVDGDFVKVSPGFTSRPSLSATHYARASTGGVSVAGIHVPAFVERPSARQSGMSLGWCRRDSRPGLR